MNHLAFFEAVKTGNIGSLYLLDGQEEYIKQQALARLCDKLLPPGMEQMNLAELHNPEVDELIAAAETMPFIAERRVIVVRECDVLTAGKKAEDEGKAEKIISYLEHVSPFSVLVFVVKGNADKRKKLYSFLKKRGGIVEFASMGDVECSHWIVQSLRAMGKQIDASTVGKLIFTVGHSAALLRQEMDKLASYTGERQNIVPEDIDAVCTKSLECTVFQMVDAQVAGRQEEAFRLLADMERNGEERIGILAMLLRQYRILYHVRCLMEEKAAAQTYAGLLGIPPFASTRAQQQVRGYEKRRLKEAYQQLLQMEYQIKSGQIPQDGCVQAALFMLDEILNGKGEMSC